jgi:hypothetical protein
MGLFLAVREAVVVAVELAGIDRGVFGLRIAREQQEEEGRVHGFVLSR